MKHKVLFTAALLTAAAGSALATDWGQHSAAESAAQVVAPGSFADAYLFTLGSTSNLSASASATNLGSAFSIADGMVSLFKDTAGPDTLVGSFAFNGTSGDTSHSWSSLVSGSYYYLVNGMATGSAGGIYGLASVASSVSPVPEPESAALLLAGLAVVGGIAKRRSKLRRD